MTLKSFLEEFSHNNIIRLLYKVEGGHTPVTDDWDNVAMDHEIIDGTRFNSFIDKEVLGVVGIIVKRYSDAINIVLKR